MDSNSGIVRRRIGPSEESQTSSNILNSFLQQSQVIGSSVKAWQKNINIFCICLAAPQKLQASAIFRGKCNVPILVPPPNCLSYIMVPEISKCQHQSLFIHHLNMLCEMYIWGNAHVGHRRVFSIFFFSCSIFYWAQYTKNVQRAQKVKAKCITANQRALTTKTLKI